MFNNNVYVIYKANQLSTFTKYVKVGMREKYFSVDGKKFHSSARLVFLHNTNQFEKVGLSLINMVEPLINSHHYMVTK